MVTDADLRCNRGGCGGDSKSTVEDVEGVEAPSCFTVEDVEGVEAPSCFTVEDVEGVEGVEGVGGVASPGWCDL
jgi:hypothetical protein